MGKKDILTKNYLSRPEIFADAFNYYLFDGKRVIKPEDLEEQDPMEQAVVKKMGRVFASQKMRDVLKLCTIRRSRNATLILLGIEAQAFVSYTMPVRDNLYDALNYYSQVEEISRKHHDAGDLRDSAKFLSGYTKEDRLKPVITLCICFDKEKWDAPKSLSEMFDEVDPRLKPFINDYKLNLITPEEIRDFSKFSSGLGQALEFIHNSGDKEKLRVIMDSNNKYEEVDEGTVDIINIYTNLKISKKGMNGGKMNMCKGMQDLIDEEKEKERKRAEAERKRAKEEKKRADAEKKRADAAEARVKELEAKLAMR